MKGGIRKRNSKSNPKEIRENNDDEYTIMGKEEKLKEK